MLKVGTDFSGIGAPEQALNQMGIPHSVEFACDYDRWAKKSYLTNYTPKIFYDNVSTRDHSCAPYVDLYVAGFPCQAFSIAGKRAGFEDTRGTLFFDLLQYLKAHRPKYFLLENVKGLINHNKGNTYRVIMECLRELKYKLYAKVLNTKNFGIPQNRERVFIVGFRDEHTFEWPQPIELKLRIKDILQDNPNGKYFLSEIAVEKIKRHNNKSLDNEVSNTIHAGYYKMGGRDQQYIEVEEKYYLKDAQIKKLEEYNERNKKNGNGFRAKFHDTQNDMMSSLKVGGARADDLIKEGEVRGCALRTWPRKSSADKSIDRQKRLEFRSDGVVNTITTHQLDSMVGGDIEFIADVRTDEGLRIRDNKLSPCLTASKNSASEISRSAPLIKKEKQKIRRLTPLECLRLQGFEDEFFHKCKEQDISDTQLYKQAGNSMSVNVVKKIINEILKNETRNF